MRAKILVFWVILAMSLASLASADMEVVESSFGSMVLSGNFQAGFNFYIGDEQLNEANYQAADRSSDMEFYLNRVRFVVMGQVVDEKVKYFMQLEAANQAGVQLADMKLGFSYIPYTTIWVGRWLPHFQHWTPVHTGRHFLIDYPLAHQFFGVQRHTGLEVEFNHEYVDIYLMVNNGHNYNNFLAVVDPGNRVGADGSALDTLGNQGWNEENSAKDIYFTVNGKPTKGLDIFASVWYGTPVDYFENDQGELIEHNASFIALDGGVGYVADYGVRLWAEVFYSMMNFDSGAPPDGSTDRLDDTYELTSMSYYVRAGYNLKHVSGVPMEFLVQYDWLDPDTLNDDQKHAASETDELTYITAGINYYIQDYHAMLYLNYIYKMEAWEDVANKAGDDTQNGINNDILKFMAQIAF